MCGFLVFTSEYPGFEEQFTTLRHRGPDDFQIVKIGGGKMGFHRLSIRDLSDAGNQPFEAMGTTLVCNGEIYNSEKLKEEVSFSFTSSSDCEVLIPLYKKYGIKKMAKKLDAEFALVLYDKEEKVFKAARDAMGIRPLFYGKLPSGDLAFSSEAKALLKTCSDIKPFPPGSYYDGEKILPFIKIGEVEKFNDHSLEEVCANIQIKLEDAVIKRLQSDAPVGFLLSGGLDSSLVCSIASKYSDKPIKTFSIGMESDAIDLKYARDVAEFLGTDHTEVIITPEQVMSYLETVIQQLETWDITTIRASMGMSLLCKWIHENTDIKVLLTGEVSDELFGYKYTDFAPSEKAFQAEAKKRIEELYIYDVLRADRCISAHSIEARVPFSDTDFVQYVMAIQPKLKMNFTGVGKYLLRKAFAHGDYLPEHILYREKAAFSDAVGHSLVDILKLEAEAEYEKVDLIEAKLKYPYKTPFTKESLMYREIFEKHYPKQAQLIKDYWMPNKEWENCDVDDPSARVLPNYGASGA